MAKIITITANTALDFFIEVDGLAGRDNILAQSSVDFACGKGVNVAKAVSCLKHSVTCLGFVGDQSIESFKAIDSDLISVDFTPVPGKTRTNITLCDVIEQKETHIRTAGYSVNQGDCYALLETIAEHINTDDIVVLSGSLPPAAPDELYRKIIDLCHENRALSFLDSNGLGLQEGIKAKPFLLKPNLQELEELLGTALMDEQAIISAARQLIELGVQWLYISMGQDGFIVVNRDEAFSVSVQPVSKDKITTVGCGDAMLAGLAVATLNNQILEDKLKLAAACATANLFSVEPGCFKAQLVKEIMPYVRIEKVRRS